VFITQSNRCMLWFVSSKTPT